MLSAPPKALKSLLEKLSNAFYSISYPLRSHSCVIWYHQNNFSRNGNTPHVKTQKAVINLKDPICYRCWILQQHSSEYCQKSSTCDESAISSFLNSFWLAFLKKRTSCICQLKTCVLVNPKFSPRYLQTFWDLSPFFSKSYCYYKSSK